MPENAADESDATREAAVYWRHRTRTHRALLCVGISVMLLLVFHEPRAWGAGEAAAVVHHVAQLGLWIAGLVAYVSHGRMAERRGFCEGRFRRSPLDIRREAATNVPK
jgi:hypothetical protein